MQIGFALGQYGRKSGNGEAFPAWHHRFGPEDDVRIYAPDLVFVCAPRHNDALDYADRASDVTVEIVSPSESAARLTSKVEFYIENGAKSVWVVEPRERRVDVYAPGRPMRTFGSRDTLTDPVLPGFDLPLSDLFTSG